MIIQLCYDCHILTELLPSVLALIYVMLSPFNDPSQSIDIKYHTKISHVNILCHSTFFKLSISYR